MPLLNLFKKTYLKRQLFFKWAIVFFVDIIVYTWIDILLILKKSNVAIKSSCYIGDLINCTLGYFLGISLKSKSPI